MQMMQGKDPQAMLNQLIASGKVTQEDVNRAIEMARQYAPLLKGIFR